MPLIANKIDHYVQLAPTSPCPSDNVRDKLQHAHIQDLTGVLKQLEMLSEYASDIFTGLISSATHTNERIRAMGGRVDNVLGHLNYLEELSTEQCDKKDIQPLLEKDTPLSAPIIRSKGIQKLYSDCHANPRLHMLDAFKKDEGGCMKKFSDPFFFMDEWMKEESLRQEKALQEREERRQKRKEARNKAHVPNAGSCSVQRQKLLTIRTWRDTYGTGQDTEHISPALEAPAAIHVDAADVTLATAAEEDVPDNDSVDSNDANAPELPKSPDLTSALVAARRSYEASPKETILPPPPPMAAMANINSAMENVKPETANIKPPSPVQNASHHDDIPPPPPIVVDSTIPKTRPAPNFLGEIRAGKTLRSAKKTKDAPIQKPIMSDLLQQITQSKQLRPVASKVKVETPKESSYTNVISDILARRAAIAGDSDEASENSDDDDWN